jgi:hypothetical protein
MTYRPYLLFRQTPEQLRQGARGGRATARSRTPRPWPKPSPPWMLGSLGCGGPRSAARRADQNCTS